MNTINTGITPQDIKNVATGLKQSISTSEMEYIISHFAEAQKSDPSATFNLVIEQLIDEVISQRISPDQIKEVIIRQKISSRGGGIEISLDSFGFPDQKMSAYQNYLGGGMLGAIQTNDTIRRQTLTTDKRSAQKLDKIAEALARYFHALTNHEENEWESDTFEENQNRPTSAY